MASASKQSTKSNKSTDTKTKTTDNSNSEMESTKSHIYNARFRANPQKGKDFLDTLDIIATNFFEDNDESKDAILELFWGEDRESLEKLITKSNKREKVKAAEFKPSGLEKPKKAIDIFGLVFSEKSKADGVKFSKENNYLTLKRAAWVKLSQKEKDKYNKQAADQKAAYDTELEKQKSAALKNGDFPQPKPKGPVNGYFRFAKAHREELTEQFKNEFKGMELQNKISSEAGVLWGKLSDKEKEPFDSAYRKEKELYDVKLQEWKATELERLKKNSGEVEDVKVESTGKKEVAKPKEKVVNQPTIEDEEEADEEAVAAPVKEKKKSEKAEKAPKAEKTEKAPKAEKAEKAEKTEKTEKAPKAKAKADTDDEEAEAAPVPVKEKKTSEKVTKPKAKASKQSDDEE